MFSKVPGTDQAYARYSLASEGQALADRQWLVPSSVVDGADTPPNDVKTRTIIYVARGDRVVFIPRNVV